MNTVYMAYNLVTNYAIHSMRSANAAFGLLEKINRGFQQVFPPSRNWTTAQRESGGLHTEGPRVLATRRTSHTAGLQLERLTRASDSSGAVHPSRIPSSQSGICTPDSR